MVMTPRGRSYRSTTGDTGVACRVGGDIFMPRPAPRNHHSAVAAMSEENDASTPKAPDANRAAAAMRPVEASTACFVPEEAPAAAPTTAATMNAPPTQ